MAETVTPPPAGGMSPDAEEAGFYHEAALNATWTGSRLAIGALSFLFGAFVFAFFYLRSINSAGRWHGSGYHPPNIIFGTFILFVLLLSATANYVALQRLKAGDKRLWQIGVLTALALGVGSVAMMIINLMFLPFWPGSSGFSSVYVGFWPVYLTIVLAMMIWLETLIVAARPVPAISFVEQPPTYAETVALQRLQANLSAFTTVWNFLAGIAVLFWLLFYVIT
jgi:heme/copper-type cytochrome/quinol oxidase subunit 3